MGKKAMWVQTLVFVFFIALFFILNLLIPEKGFSERENRVLQTAPEFSLESLFAGKFTSAYEDYITDQFVFRDGWITLKARSELLSGKEENNGVYLCEGDTLIERFEKPNYDDIDFSTNAVNALAESSDAPVYFALIPSASEIWREKLPDGAPGYSQKDIIDHIYAYTSAMTVDIYSALQQHSGEDIFYRTDHHWTTLGAYYGYAELMHEMGIAPLPLSAYSPDVVTDSFYGTTYSSSGFSWVPPDSITVYVEQGDVKITNYPQGTPQDGKLYDESFLNVKDKYSYFYGGNTPLIEVDTGNDGKPSLLIIRDSYMDSFSPFLFPHFSNISILDLRYYKTSLKAYIDENHFDNILICYSVPNFVTDGDIFRVAD